MVGRGSYAKTPATKNAILDAALTVIATRGYSAASLQDIAEQAGVSKAGILHHFGSREQLLVAILERRDDAGRARAREDGLGPFDGFVRALQANAESPGLVALHASLTGAAGNADSAMGAFLKARFDGIIEALSSPEIESTQSSDLSSEDLARILLATADGLQVQWLLDRDVDMAGLLGKLLAALGISLEHPIAQRA